VWRKLADSKERKRATNAAWRAANAEKKKAYAAKWYAENRDKAKANSAAWAAANPDKAKANVAKWYAANAESNRLYSHNRRAREREVGGRLSKGLAEKLFKLQRGKCACCGVKIVVNHLDHRIPVALGGPNEDWNMQLLCPPCNLSKHAKDPIDFMQSRGFLL